jgi:hypothetical protein
VKAGTSHSVALEKALVVLTYHYSKNLSRFNTTIAEAQWAAANWQYIDQRRKDIDPSHVLDQVCKHMEVDRKKLKNEMKDWEKERACEDQDPLASNRGDCDPEYASENVIVKGPIRKQLEVKLKDTAWSDEKLGKIVLEWTTVVSRSGKVYCTSAFADAQLNSQATQYLDMGASIVSNAYSKPGGNFCEIDFRIHIGGPNTTSTSSSGLELSVGIKQETGLEGGGSLSFQHSSAKTSKAAKMFRRLVTIQPDMTYAVTKKDFSGLVIEDKGHDGWGPDTDWIIHSHGN